MRFTVSILTYTALRQAKGCIASILKSTQPFNLILTANGNPDAAAYFTQLAAEFPNIRVIINAIGIALTAEILPGIHVANNDLGTLLIIGLVLGVVVGFYDLVKTTSRR